MIDTKMKNNVLRPVVYVSWEESERGWGIRPDGCSLHLTEEDFRKYEKWYWESMEETYGDKAPDEYSRPAGRPVTAYASKKLYEEIKKSKDGLYLTQDAEGEATKSNDLIYGSERSGWVSVTKTKEG